MSADDYRPFLPPLGAKIAGPTPRAHAQARMKSPRAQGLFAKWEQMFAEPFRGITTDGHVIPDLYAPRPEGAPTLADDRGGQRAARAPVARAEEGIVLSGRLAAMAALAEHRALRRGLRAAARRGGRTAARGGDGGAARQHEPARLRAVARRDAAQPLPRRSRRRACGAGRMELHFLPVRHAVDERALGLAVFRAPPRSELLRAGRADGADAGVLGRRAELRRSRAVQGHHDCSRTRSARASHSCARSRRSSRSARSSRIR